MSVEVKQNQPLEIDLKTISLPLNASLLLESQAEHGVVSVDDLSFAKYVPNAGFHGLDEFKYRITQTTGQTDIYTVRINVLLVEDRIIELQVERVASWKNDATAAYTIIHDDLCAWDVAVGGMFQNWRELEKRNLVAGFGVIAGFCDDSKFNEMQVMVDAGMEMVNHSYSHIDLQEHVDQWSQEFDLSTKILREHGFETNYFVFPFDSFNDAMFIRLNNQLGYLGSRGSFAHGNLGVVNTANMPTSDDLQPYRNKFDIYNEFDEFDDARFSAYTGSQSPLDAYVDDAVRHGGWAIRELHGINYPDSWGNVPLDVYRLHLNHVKKLVDENSLWMDTPTNITRYRSSRAYCGDAVVNNGSITFMTPTAAGCQKYATPLTVIISATGSDTIKATQNGDNVPVKALDETQYIVNIDPTKGATNISGG